MANKIGYKEPVSVTGTEKEFITALISAITGLDSSISCSGSIDQYDSSDTSIKPTFIFSVNNKQVLKIRRGNSLSEKTYYFEVYINSIAGDFSISSIINFIHVNNTRYASDSAHRKFYLSWIVIDNFILLSISAGEQNTNFVRAVYAKSNNKHYNSGSNGSNDSKANVYNISGLDFIEIDSNPIVHGTFASRFSFTSKPGTIDYVKSAAYINNGYKAFDLSSVCDCTTVNIGDTVSLNDGAYLAVGPHQLVKVS